MAGGAATRFAPAERSPPGVVARQRARFEAERAFCESIQRVPDLVAVLNGHRQVVCANRRLLDAAGAASLDEAAGKRFGELLGCVHGAETEGGCGTTPACRHCGAVNAVLASRAGSPAVEECRLRVPRGDGEEALDLRVWASPLGLDGEDFTFLAATDIADEKRRLFLEKIFLHDIANTVMALQGLLLLLRGARPGAGDPGDPVRDAVATARRLGEEIRAHGSLVMAESGELKVEPRRVSSRALLEGIRDSYGSPDFLAGRELRMAGDAGDVEFTGDPVLMGRVLGNLVKNALEASAPGEAVTLSCRREGGEVLFSVHNPAVMPEAVRLQVFQRSFSTRGPGRGLGTYGSRLLAERYLGGRVAFDSGEGRGTTFVAAFPAGSA